MEHLNSAIPVMTLVFWMNTNRIQILIYRLALHAVCLSCFIGYIGMVVVLRNTLLTASEKCG